MSSELRELGTDFEINTEDGESIRADTILFKDGKLEIQNDENSVVVPYDEVRSGTKGVSD